MKKSVRVSSGLFPTPVVMISCQEKEGRPNIITLAWVGVACSEPPIVSISIRPDRHSYPIIKNSQQFVVNVPDLSLVKTTDYCGNVSGRNVDKFKESGLSPIPCEKVMAPMIKECPINLECTVNQVIPLGTHHLFLGEVIAAHVNEEILDERGRIDAQKAQLLVFWPGKSDYWDLKDKLGVFGFSRK